MSSFLILLAAATTSALPQFQRPFNNFQQFRPAFQNFPQQLSGFQFPQGSLPNIGSLPSSGPLSNIGSLLGTGSLPNIGSLTNLGSRPSIGSLSSLFNPSQLVGGPSSLPPWLRPKTDAAAKENTAEAASRFIDNTGDATTEATPIVADDPPKSDDANDTADVGADQKAYEDYLKHIGYGTNVGYTSGYSGYPSGYTSYPYTNNVGYIGGYNGGYTGGYTGGLNTGFYNYPSYSGGYTYPSYTGSYIYG